MADPQTAGNAQQGDRREGGGLWPMLQVRD